MFKKIVLILTFLVTTLTIVSCFDDDNSSTTEPENKLPTCEITSPANNSEFIVGSTVTVNVDASDEDGEIEKVEFYFDGGLISTATNSPYSIEINTSTYTAGSHIIKAISTDNDNAEKDVSITVILNVQNDNNILFLKNYTEVKEIEYSGSNVSIEVSGSIYSPDVAGPNYVDPIRLLILGVSNEQDGSALVSKTFEGTHKWNSNPESWEFTSNSGTNKIWVVGITLDENNNLEGSYNVIINGNNHTIETNNVIFLKSYDEIKEIEYSGSNVPIEVSDYIYSPDVAGPNYVDPIRLLTLGVSNEQDGSALVSKTFDGTHKWNSNPESWEFTSNSGTNKIWAVGITLDENNNLEGSYKVNVNGVNSFITP